MYIAQVKIENFRIFGEAANALILELQPGLTALVGENDAGKTAIVDALRLVFGTRDQEYFRLEETDYHQPDGEVARNEICIRCKFDDLTLADRGAFAEYLTYEQRGEELVPVIYVNWKASRNRKAGASRRFTAVEVRSGQLGDGPQIDVAARQLLFATYLRPLRDAERAMSAGRGSRLSQILQYTKEVTEHGVDFDPNAGVPEDPSTLSVLGVGDFAGALLQGHQGLASARERLNKEYLDSLSFAGSPLAGNISVSAGNDELRLRQLLEKLELELRDPNDHTRPPNRGLGSNNILFMACELLLLGSEEDGFPLLIVEEPEAHLHPQRQLRLIQFLQERASVKRADGQSVQIILTTHSPNLASAITLSNLVIVQAGRAFPLPHGKTKLDLNDYSFLQRFLDVTKANLFFARGVLIVEGDAENILLPTVARLIGRDLTHHGVSIVNVGTTGLGRFARIYQRADPETDGQIQVPVACVADLDVLPDCAPTMIGKIKAGDDWPDPADRKWRVVSDFDDEALAARRADIRQRASGQHVETFVSDHWTLEYDLTYSGLEREMWLAVQLASQDERIAKGQVSAFAVCRKALRSWAALEAEELSPEEKATQVYAPLAKGSVSKPITAQYLARILELGGTHKRSTDEWRTTFPEYLISAIDYVTVLPNAPEPEEVQADA